MHKYNYNYKFNKLWLFQALKRDQNKCTDCSSSESLIVHHVDESRKNGLKSMNNTLSNLLTLCRACHAKAHRITISFKNPKYTLIKELRGNGLTYQEIGDYIGVSRQRVHQIIAKLPY